MELSNLKTRAILDANISLNSRGCVGTFGPKRLDLLYTSYAKGRSLTLYHSLPVMQKIDH